MSDDLERRIQAALNTGRAKLEAEKEKQAADDKRKKEISARKTLNKTLWETNILPLLKKAVADLNTNLAENGLPEMRVSEFGHAGSTLAQIELRSAAPQRHVVTAISFSSEHIHFHHYEGPRNGQTSFAHHSASIVDFNKRDAKLAVVSVLDAWNGA